MKWVNHLAIAGATTAVASPALVPVALLGSTAPDWLEWVLRAVGQPVKHRTVTHYVLAWALALAFALILWDFHGLLAAFAWGGVGWVEPCAGGCADRDGCPVCAAFRPAFPPVWWSAAHGGCG